MTKPPLPLLGSNRDRRRLRCALLATFRFDWAATIVLATPGIEFCCLPAESLGLPQSPNPFALPLSDEVDVVLISTLWYYWLRDEHHDSIAGVFARLEKLSSAIVGLDAGDEFLLSLPPEAFARFGLVLKAQGLYRDRELYNYEVGPHFPGANWTGKVKRRAQQYSDEDLSKLRLSVPCIMLDFLAVKRDGRRREATGARTLDRDLHLAERVGRDLADALMLEAVTHAPLRGRPLDVHCLVALSHLQRLDALRALRDFSGMQGVASVPRVVLGTEHGFEISGLALEEIRSAAEPHRHPPVARSRFMYEMCRHKVGVAPTGFGELGQRHAAIMRCGAALVCQDLSHVEMMFPIQDHVNASFCRPDLADLNERVRELLSDEPERRRIAARGRRSLHQWSKRWREHLVAGVERPLREALGWPTPQGP